MNILDLIYRYDQWGIRQNHAGRRNNNRLDDPNLLLISVGHEAEYTEPLLTSLLRLAQSEPTGTNRPGMPAEQVR